MAVDHGYADFELDASGTFPLQSLLTTGVFKALNRVGETVYRSVNGAYDMPGEIRFLSTHVPNVYVNKTDIAPDVRASLSTGRRCVMEMQALARKTNDTTGEVESYLPYKVSVVIHAPNSEDVGDADIQTALKVLLGSLTTIDGGAAELESVIHRLRSGVTEVLG